MKGTSNVNDKQWPWMSVPLIMALYFVINSTFRYSPFFPNSLELGILLSFLVLVKFTRSRFPREARAIVIYSFALMLYVLVVPAIVASRVHEQSVIVGLAANRAAFLILVVMCFAFMIFSRRFTLKSVEVSLLTLSWVNMIIGGAILLFLDPNQFSPEEWGTFLNDGGGSRNEFNLPKGLTLVGAFYYFFNGFYLDKYKEKLYCLLMFSYVALGGNHRALLLSLVLTIFIVVLWGKALKKGSRIRFFLKLNFSILLIVAVSYIFFPQALDARISSFIDAFSVVSGADQVEDWSAGARIEQFSIAIPGILAYPFFGQGHLSNAFNGGFNDLYGYFHPSDLGLIGVIFVFGVVGLLFLSCQYVFFFRSLRAALSNLRCRYDHSLLFAAVCMLLVHSINSITSGMFAFYPERGLFWLLLIVACLRSHATYTASSVLPAVRPRSGYAP